MRLGCGGCLGSLLGLGLVAFLVGGAAVVGSRLLAVPEPDPTVTTAADGARGQQKLFSLARRDPGGRSVALTEAEVNALLDRHLVEAGGTRLSGLRARLPGDDRLHLRADTSLDKVLDEVGLGAVGRRLPARWRERRVQLRVDGRVSVEDTTPRYLRLDVGALWVGRQPLPPFALRLLVDPAAVGLLRWRLPAQVDRVAIEPGRVVIQTRTQRPGT